MELGFEDAFDFDDDGADLHGHGWSLLPPQSKRQVFMPTNREEHFQKLAKTLSPRIAKLELQKWKEQVYGRILYYAYKPIPLRTTGGMLFDEAKVMVLLEKLEMLSRLSIPKVVVWKAKCLYNDGKPIGDGGLLDLDAWKTIGWKRNKQARAADGAIDTIKNLVAPFL